MSTCYGLNCVLPKKRDVGILSPSNPEGNLIGIQGLYKCKQEKMRSLGCDWCQKKKEKSGQKETHTQEKLHVKMKAEILVMFLKAKEGQRWAVSPEARDLEQNLLAALWRNDLADIFIPDF